MRTFKEILDRCRSIINNRDVVSATNYTMSELGELAIEVNRVRGGLPSGPDGILGECADVLLCIFDVLQQAHPGTETEDLSAMLSDTLVKKADKWEEKHT